MPLLPPGRVADLPDWIVRFATDDDHGDRLLEGVCRTLLGEGLPLWRMSISAPTLDPLIRGATLVWHRDADLEIVAMNHGPEAERTFQRGPIPDMLARGSGFERWSLAGREGCLAHPFLDDLREAGGTDCAVFLVGFSQATVLAGAAIFVVTDRPGGFEAADIAAIAGVVPALGLAIYRQLLLIAATQALSSYLGPMTGARVLAGQVRRGQGETIAAAILLADLCRFTALTDREDPVAVVGWLNEHLEAIGDPVTAAGGEILKFLGDGLLAVFPASDGAARPCAACEAALRAARDALARNAALNGRRAQAGEPQLALDVALHFGEVVYGNVGTPTRLDFTAIGRAVNEASRIEKLCDGLGHHLVASEEFAGRCRQRFAALGSFTLRGVDTPRTILAPETA